VSRSIASVEAKVPVVEPAAVVLPFVPAAYGATDPGRVRETNEDSFAVLPPLGLFMVADGVGGAAAGEVASRMVIERVQRAVEEGESSWPRDAPASGSGPESGPRRFLAGIHQANRSIHRHALADLRKKGMGTTFAGLLLLERCAVIAHVGDSRVYRLRDGALDRITRDHTLANHLLDRGHLTPDEAASYPRRHIITRAVGTREAVEVDTRIVDIQPGDAFLLCTDGLHGEVGDAEIAATLREGADPATIVGRLIAQANDAGGTDNVTAVLVRLEAGPVSMGPQAAPNPGPASRGPS
jgi:serine/threonine protein phosphatase PrpC